MKVGRSNWIPRVFGGETHQDLQTKDVSLLREGERGVKGGPECLRNCQNASTCKETWKSRRKSLSSGPVEDGESSLGHARLQAPTGCPGKGAGQAGGAWSSGERIGGRCYF